MIEAIDNDETYQEKIISDNATTILA